MGSTIKYRCDRCDPKHEIRAPRLEEDPIQPKVKTISECELKIAKKIVERGDDPQEAFFFGTSAALALFKTLDDYTVLINDHAQQIVDLNKEILELREDYKNLSEAFDDHERYTVSLEERIEKLEALRDE